MTQESLDFEEDADAARRHINEWIAERTGGKIKDLLTDDSVTDESTIVLANTACFRGYWTYAFNKNGTRTGKFAVSNKRNTNVEIMKQRYTRDLFYFNSTELGAQVLEMPYEGAFASMYIFLPHDVEGLSTLENRLNAKTIATALGALIEERVLVSMPKFTIDKGVSLVQALGKMGLADLFDPSKSILSGFDGSKRRAMTDILHKAYVVVDEEGKVAAAVPASGITVTIESVKYDVNRPFFFLVMDKSTQAIVFMGRVAKP